MSDLQRLAAAHLWSVHHWGLTAKKVDGPEHLARVTDGLWDNHRLEHIAATQGQIVLRPHGHPPELEP